MNRFVAIAVFNSLWLVNSIASASTNNDSDNTWKFQLAPLFLWGMSIDGDASIGNATAPLDLNFKDQIFENMEAVYTIYFDAKRNRLSLFTEYQFVDLRPTVEIGPTKVDIGFETTMFELGAGYAFSENIKTRWEFIGGARYTKQNIDVDASLNLPSLSNGPGLQNINQQGGDSWWHAFFGARIEQKLSERWILAARLDAGYGGSDNSALNGSFLFDYSYKHWGSVFFGYKIMQYDYASGSGNDRYAYNATQQGPLLGLNFRW